MFQQQLATRHGWGASRRRLKGKVRMCFATETIESSASEPSMAMDNRPSARPRSASAAAESVMPVSTTVFPDDTKGIIRQQCRSKAGIPQCREQCGRLVKTPRAKLCSKCFMKQAKISGARSAGNAIIGIKKGDARRRSGIMRSARTALVIRQQCRAKASISQCREQCGRMAKTPRAK